MHTMDQLVLGLDRALRTLNGLTRAHRESPAAQIDDEGLPEQNRAHVAGLMRINHTGEVCAQALYEGQALTARSDTARDALLHAAEEEGDHLVWCRERLEQLDSRPSVLDPLFYTASFALGAVTGLAGDKISLGFVEATEDRVVKHLEAHMEEVPYSDKKTHAILAQMREDEAHHADQALGLGGVTFPAPVKALMTAVSKVMTLTTYRI
ncbi:MAG: 2-polyprenyl-3-methyl-6-methoxy-1,4-benzoquinone monooxygenase [Pseudomonadota bacterium]